ncbi:MAG: hypothetical protein J0L82_19590 [Deltaproteobacteria bacterium]|jgi:hypothetical protein|nr:hypothetical protein [Deltaproteobacteria bacterium]
MKRKLQVVLNDETWTAIEGLTKEANDGFINGTITYSDIVNEILLTAKLDIRGLQAKHTNIRKSLRLMASQKEIDIDSAIRALMDLKSKGAKKSMRSQISMDGIEQ